MVFTTQLFIFVFFPICFLAYYAACRFEKTKLLGNFFTKFRIKDLVLIAFSLGFYAWSCFFNVFKLILYIIVIYFAGCWIEKLSREKHYIPIMKKRSTGSCELSREFYLALPAFFGAIVMLILVLIYYKYFDFLLSIWSRITATDIPSKNILAPLGISFITFSAISYLADIYSGKASSGTFVDCALYISFFPKIVSGPIALWKDFQTQIADRVLTLDTGIEGINRIMIGCAKKVILADSFGKCVGKIGTSGVDRITVAGSILLYMLQIYYDFSGYSDIAIGLAKLFGFRFHENFNFPYRSASISEFWRRWHISLGTWFREYVYYPLGGSKKGYYKTLRNLAVVFALTGIWHGAGKNYILWGAINGALVLLERIIQNKPLYQKTPKCIKYIATMSIVMLLWQLFQYHSIRSILYRFAIMCGVVRFDRLFYTWRYYFDAQIITFVVIGILGATVLGSPRIIAMYNKLSTTKTGFIIQELLLLTVFVLAILFMVNSTYSPFIYFQY